MYYVAIPKNISSQLLSASDRMPTNRPQSRLIYIAQKTRKRLWKAPIRSPDDNLQQVHGGVLPFKDSFEMISWTELYAFCGCEIVSIYGQISLVFSVTICEHCGQHIRVISEGSRDTEDWSNDAENSALITEISYILEYIKKENSYFKL